MIKDKVEWLAKRKTSELFRKSKLVRICFFTIIVRIDTKSKPPKAPRTVTFGGILLFVNKR